MSTASAQYPSFSIIYMAMYERPHARTYVRTQAYKHTPYIILIRELSCDIYILLVFVLLLSPSPPYYEQKSHFSN